VTAPAPDPDSASLEIIHAELDRRQAGCEARWNAIDTKAGLLLAAAGVLIAFNADKASVLILVAELLAAGSGAAAIRSMFPRKGRTSIRRRCSTTSTTSRLPRRARS
jgi:hypothetical protein